MVNEPMELHGQCLLDYMNGDKDTNYYIERDDGFKYQPLFAKNFFYENYSFTDMDQIALDNCSGKILDLGAGVGPHSIYLLGKGHDVTSIEKSSKAVEIMKSLKIRNAKQGDFFDNFGETYETILLLRGISLIGTIEKVGLFLNHIKHFLSRKGHLITDSYDLEHDESDKIFNIYRQKNINEKKYFGEAKWRFVYKNQKSNWFNWLYIDSSSLSRIAQENGFTFTLLYSKNNRYLCKISMAALKLDEKSGSPSVKKPERL